MPTNEERREVAARLRKLAPGSDWPDMTAEACGLNPREMSNCLHEFTGELCDRLSDLIEPEPINGKTSDGYHTFNELYHHRALLFSVVVRNYPELCWKSKKHHTGDMYEGMFIVGIDTPDGQASYHYDIDPYWDMFECEELELAPEWDGHTPAQAIERIGKLARHEPECTFHVSDPNFAGVGRCSPSWEYRFPPVLDVPGSIDEQLGKVDGEVTEAIRASFLETKWRVAEELMDVIHAAETALRMLEEDGVDLDGVRRGVIAKNEERGYYG